jgi:hypothetical protein
MQDFRIWKFANIFHCPREAQVPLSAPPLAMVVITTEWSLSHCMLGIPQQSLRVKISKLEQTYCLDLGL